ncbi:MAG TPA: ribonuclease Z, partial [bacterium]|nr:ribonuclease Z [bacterium]
MAAREVIFLGTSSQVPTRSRNHNAFFVRWDDIGVLFDPGEGTQRQMVQIGLSASQITHIAITHFHGDHCLGFAGMVQRISLDRVPHDVEVLYPASGQVFFDRLRRASIFDDHAKIVPKPIAVRPGEIEVTRAGSLRFLARALDHAVECVGYRLQEDDGRRMLQEKLEALRIRGPAVGTLQRDGSIEHEGKTVRVEEVSVDRPGQSLAVTMDTRPCEGARELAKGVDVLVSESTYLSTEAEEARAYAHMTAKDAATLAVEAGARKLALTHFSQRYGSLEAFRAEASA